MPTWLVAVLIVFVAGVVVVALDVGLRHREPRSDDGHWVGGIFYFNRDDRRLLLPKRFGWGQTLNFAHPGSWVILLVPIVVAIAGGLHQH